MYYFKIIIGPRLIIVNQKLQTGFNCPDLFIMYIDKLLSGATCVQTMGRINRIAPGKKDVYVVDFWNPTRKVIDIMKQYSGIVSIQQGVEVFYLTFICCMS
jgi:type I restriction enzyme, R subunit